LYSIFGEARSIRRYDSCPIQETHVTKSCGIVNNNKCFVGGCLFHLQGPSNPWATEDEKKHSPPIDCYQSTWRRILED